MQEAELVNRVIVVATFSARVDLSSEITDNISYTWWEFEM